MFHSSSKSKYIPNVLPILSIDDKLINREKVRKFLGILLDENLSWKYHIDAMTHFGSSWQKHVHRESVVASNNF